MHSPTIAHRRLGWKRQKSDIRDHKFKVASPQPLRSVYLGDNNLIAPVYDQGNLGSCVSNAVAFLVEFDLMNKHVQTEVTAFIPSRLFIYYFGRVLEGTVSQDDGLEVRDGIKVINEWGVAEETMWPYNIERFTEAPPQIAIIEARNFESVSYQAVDQSRSGIVNALLQGFPVTFGFTVYDSFMSDEVAETGWVPMPDLNTEGIQGGHCVVITGYRIQDDTFLVRNSWGPSWGFNGHCRMPAKYIVNPTFASDFWVINEVK